MTLTHTREQSLAAERVAVRVVDSDVHPVPRQGVLADYIPEPWRSKFFAARRVGERIYYDARITHTAMRCGQTRSLPTANSPAATPIWRFGR